MVFFFTWFPTFLQKTRGVSPSESGRLTSWAGLGAMLGALLGGWVSDRILQATGRRRLSRQGVAVAGMTCCALLIVAAYFVRDTERAMLLISLGAFWGAFGGVSGYSVAIAFGGRHVATVFGAMNTCGNVGAALFPLGVGWWVARTGDWDFALFLFAGIFAVDAVLWALLNPRGTLFEEAEP
jgi:sugar phosphate permease